MSEMGRKSETSPFESSDASLSEALQEAFLPEALDPARNELLIEWALARNLGMAHIHSDDASAPLDSPELSPLQANPGTCGESAHLELQQAEELALALEGGRQHPLAELAEVIRSAYAPRSLAPSLSEQLAIQALTPQRSPRVRIPRAWRYVAPAIALAAGVALWLGAFRSIAPRPREFAASELVRTRSLSPLFAETLEQPSPSQRIDRIYAVRSKELRHNRFTLWRVR